MSVFFVCERRAGKEMIRLLQVEDWMIRSYLHYELTVDVSATIWVSGYCGLLLGSPVIHYEIITFVVPSLTEAERRFLSPIVLGSFVLFYAGITFSYFVLTPAALTFFANYAQGVVESLCSIDQYFEFVLIVMFSTGLSF
ncbi:Sec-independent protein translocase protein TATC chloroplastic [Bienertia sinuspersici]